MIGSHNTFTYLRPANLASLLLWPTARCQRSFVHSPLCDIRIRVHRGRWWVTHGPCRFVLFTDAMRQLEEMGPERPKNVRLLIDGKPSACDLARLSAYIWAFRHTLYFHCGRHRSTWAKLLPALPELDVEQHVGSMQSRLIGKLWPWLWTRLNRRKLDALKQAAASDTSTYHLFDFL